MSIRRRVEDLEQKPHLSVATPPPETEEVAAARRAFWEAEEALRARAGGPWKDHSEDDPVVGELAKAARSAYRHYIRVTRGGRHERVHQ
jgi:hypothetical protein